MSDIEEKDILRTAEALSQVEPSGEAVAKALRRVRGALAESRTVDHRRRRRSVIMRIAIPSGIAAAVLIAVGILLSVYATQEATAAEQLKEVAKINDAYKGWIHITLVSVKSKPTTQPIPKSGAIHANTADNTIIQVVQTDDGKREVIYASASLGEIWRYNSRTNNIEIGSLDPYSAQQMSTSVLDQATAKGFLDRLSEGGKKKLNVKKSGEGRFDRFEIAPIGPGGFQKATLLVDPESKLIQKLIVVGEMGVDQLVAVYEYSYGEPGIKDIYSLDVPRDAVVIDNRSAASQPTRPPKDTSVKAVPRDAKVVDNRPGREVKGLLDRLEKRIAAGLGDHVAVLTSSSLESNGKPSKRRGILRFFAVSGKKMYSTQYYVVGKPQQTKSTRPLWPGGVPKGWPRLDAKEIIKQLGRARPFHYFLMDGKQAWVGHYQSQSKSYMTQHFPPKHLARFPNSLQAEQGVAGRIWPSPQLRGWYGLEAKTEILADRDHPNQVGLRVESYSHPSPKRKERHETILWLDPARNDVPVEKIFRTYGRTVNRQDVTRYLDYSKLPDGQWYPTRWRTTSEHSAARNRRENRGIVRDTREYNLQILPGMKIDPAWFTEQSRPK